MELKQILEDTLEIEKSRLVELEENRFLLVSFCKNTSDIDKKINKCKIAIEDLENRINIL